MKISFIGLGKLGMPCAEAVAKKGYDVTGYDIKQKNSNLINIKNTLEETVKNRDIIFIATPTPHQQGYDGREPTSDKEVKDFNYDYVKEVLRQLNKIIVADQIIVLISTVLPGTVRRELQPVLTNNTLIYNPYLIAMGTVGWDMVNPDMVMIGYDTRNVHAKIKVDLLEKFYKSVCDNQPRQEIGTWEEAEAMKIFYNTFISNKISLVNMIQDVAHKLGNMNVDKVTSALSKCTMRIISPRYMRAGMGDGGACHPRDNIALRWLAKELDLGYDLFEAIMTARERQAENMALAILKYGKNVCFSSDSYKPGTNLVDGSYSLLVQYYIEKHGGLIVNGIDNIVNVVVRVHESDKIVADNNTIIFDPWRTYPKADNVVHYGK